MKQFAIFCLFGIFLISLCIGQPPSKEEMLLSCNADIPDVNFGTPQLSKNLLWSHMPLRVYIDFSESSKVELFNIYQTELLSDFRKAMTTWEEKTNNLITFIETNNSEDYDIYVKWVDELESTVTEKGVGAGGPNFVVECNDYTVIENATLLMIPDLTGCRGYYISMHELGHVLGFDHSANSSDVMYHYTVGCATEISEDDLSVIRALYS